MSNEPTGTAPRIFIAGWWAGRSEREMQRLLRQYVDSAPRRCPLTGRECDCGDEPDPSAMWN